LGDGTDESKARMIAGLDWMWRFADELFVMDDVDAAAIAAGAGVDKAALRAAWDARIDAVLAEATLARPAPRRATTGGRIGRHSEHLGHLAERHAIPAARLSGRDVVMAQALHGPPAPSPASTAACRRGRRRSISAPFSTNVPDPEIPAVSVIDLGIVREISAERVVITPTYTGCPATIAIEQSIRAALDANGFAHVAIETTLSPPWSTDWITDKGREDCARTASRRRQRAADAASLKNQTAAECPRCGSSNTEELSRFGSTPCKALWRCKSCAEPFDRFKCH
jgi:ring-1,2-phenylacetyl-CoA epoxidase subunit PaaD